MNDILWIRAKFAFWVAVFAALLVYGAYPAFSADEVFRAMPSTPDVAVSDSATSEVLLGRGVRWVFIRNDCAAPVYLDLRGRTRGFGGGVYPLRLAQNQEFVSNMAVSTIGVSPGATASSCTLTIIPAR